MDVTSGLTIFVDGEVLRCTTDSAEAADAIWVQRQDWLRRWTVSSLCLTWHHPEEGKAQLFCDRS